MNDMSRRITLGPTQGRALGPDPQRPAPLRAALTWLARRFARVAALIDAATLRLRQRRTERILMALDDRMLKDIGVARAEIASVAHAAAERAVANDFAAGVGGRRPWRWP